MSVVRDVQDKVTGRLAGQAAFGGITVMNRLKNDVVNDIEAEVQRIGITIFVFPPIPRGANPELPGPVFNRMEFRIRVIENPLLNQTSLDAYEAVEQVLRTLHNWSPGMEELGYLFVADPPVEDNSAEEVIFDCLFFAHAQFAPLEEPG